MVIMLTFPSSIFARPHIEIISHASLDSSTTILVVATTGMDALLVYLHMVNTCVMKPANREHSTH